MELKIGYKQTEVGVIPEDWSVSTVGEICVTSSGTTPSRSMRDRYYRNGTVHWVKTLDLNNSNIKETDELVTTYALEETSLRVYPRKTVLVAMYGGYNQIGRTGLLNVPAAVNQAITAIQPQANTLVPEYLLLTLNYKVEYWKSVASSSRKDPNITSYDVRSFPIAYPKPAEQRAIATALSDMDELISAQDELIAKKRDIKQATMQQLLTGKKRLPGFSGEWETKRLGDVTDMNSGGTPSSSVSSYYDGDIPWVSIADMTKSGKYISATDRNLTAKGLANSSAKLFPVGTILYAMYASIGECSIATVELCSSQAILGIRPRDRIDSHYLYFYLASKKEDIKSLGQQGTQSNLNAGMVKNFSVSLPKKEEQTAIAAVLSEMDEEIRVLEVQRDKTRALKQGMMQELLTGRIRLV